MQKRTHTHTLHTNSRQHIFLGPIAEIILIFNDHLKHMINFDTSSLPGIDNGVWLL